MQAAGNFPGTRVQDAVVAAEDLPVLSPDRTEGCAAAAARPEPFSRPSLRGVHS